MKTKILAGVAAVAMLAGTSASASSFINGGFEDGNINGWTQGGGYRGSVSNAGLSPSYFSGANNDGGRGAIITGGVDPNVGAAMGSLVYSGNNSYRVENTSNGGYATFIQQTVVNYTDSDIFFAWKSVLEGAHGTNDAATMIIKLTDLTTNTTVITRQYNAADNGAGVDGRFVEDASGNFYTPQWQIEQLSIGSALSGHTFQLSVLASDCQPTGHFGYVYLDGFGAVAPPAGPVGGVPEPSTWAMMLTGFGLAGSAIRRRRRTASPVAA